MKKRIFFILLSVCFATQFVVAQKPNTIHKGISVWTVTDKTASAVPAVIDTSLFGFQNTDPMNNYSIANSYNGALGSPLQSKIYFDRTEKTDFLFSRPYDAYFTSVSDILFYNTKSPYSNLTYYSNGATTTKDDDFKGLITLNLNKRFNFAILFNYAGAKGLYNSQMTRQVKSGIWASYSGKHYGLTGAIMYQAFNNEENGGITNPAYISNKDSMGNYSTDEIPTKLTTSTSKYTNKYIYLNQKFHLATVKRAIDSTHFEYRPIATISHTFKYEEAQKRYKSTGSDSSFYAHTYFNGKETQDSVRFRSLRNSVAFSVNEGFARWFPLSIVGYVEHDYRQYYYLNDSTPVNASENDILFGAEMSKRKGKNFLFNANGEVYTVGPKSGDFKLDGGISSSFRLLSNTVYLNANGSIKRTSPSYFENTYVSNHFIWNNDFDKTMKSHVDAKLGLHNKWIDVNVGAGVENVSKLIYFNSEALPAQYDGNIQVLSGNAKLDFNLGILHLQNKAIYQKTSDADILPLPELSTYNNLFVAFKMFKVLTTQIGTDMYYNTAYYAPNYMPATGVFYLQDKEKLGDFPVMSAYLSFHLSTARFFFKYYHYNASFSAQNYFSMPDYPLYPQRFKMGISWNLFD
ncbi:MAG: putative porin [Paludibacteraceae bacterium]|nr:putative porin [Paludibacteraceae bacterium]